MRRALVCWSFFSVSKQPEKSVNGPTHHELVQSLLDVGKVRGNRLVVCVEKHPGLHAFIGGFDVGCLYHPKNRTFSHVNVLDNIAPGSIDILAKAFHSLGQ